MSDSNTLLAYLVPKLTGRVEDSATEALAFILRKSAESRAMLAELGGIEGEDIARVETQVVADDRSRPDLVCFDADGEKRIIVEAKFWAGLMDDQPNAYIEQLPATGRSALLFVAPEVRADTLWAAINNMVGDGGIQLEPVTSANRIPTARVSGTERYLMLASWTRVLNGMLTVAETEDVRADIRQLLGLAQREDEEAFLPIHSEELGPAFARRVRGFVRLTNDAVDARGVQEGWISVTGLNATSLRHGYGRYLRLVGTNDIWWFGINHDLWATARDTPLWLAYWPQVERNLAELLDQARYPVEGRWIAIRLKTGVEYDEVLNDVVRQLREIGEAVRSATVPADAQ